MAAECNSPRVIDNTGQGARLYRKRVLGSGLVSFQVACQETDLMVRADHLLVEETREYVLECRGHIEGYIRRYPEFAAALTPWQEPSMAPEIVRRMIHAGHAAGVGPMAAVAGAIAETVGRHLLNDSRQVVVENGGDIFLKTDKDVVVGLFAGGSPLSLKVGVRLTGSGDGIGVCTSSGTVGHSLSTGRADAVCVISHSCALADAAATAIGNRIRSPEHCQAAIDFGRRIDGIHGIVTVIGHHMAAWGELALVPLEGKKG